MSNFYEDYENLRELVRAHPIYNTLPEITNVMYLPGSVTGDNYMSIVKRIKVTIYANEDEENYVSLIVKRQLPSMLRRQLFRYIDIFGSEIHFYNVVFHYLRTFGNSSPELLIPDCYFAGRDDKGEIIVLEDLMGKGFRLCNRRIPFSVEFGKRLMMHLARFHASSIVAKVLDPDGFLRMRNSVGDVVFCQHAEYLYSRLLRISVAVALRSLINNNLNETLTPAIRIVRRLYGRMYLCMRRCVLRASEKMSVICHGDLCVTNIMDDGINLKFIDFQAVRYGSPIFDILHVMFTSSRSPLRQSSMRVLLQDYASSLIDAVRTSLPHHSDEQLRPILEQFSINKLIEEYYRNIVYGLSVALWVLPAVTFDPNNIPNLDNIDDSPEAEIDIEQLISNKLTSRYHIRIRETITEFIENNHMDRLLQEMEECGDFDMIVQVPLAQELIDYDYLPFPPDARNGNGYQRRESDSYEGGEEERREEEPVVEEQRERQEQRDEQREEQEQQQEQRPEDEVEMADQQQREEQEPEPEREREQRREDEEEMAHQAQRDEETQ